MTWEYGPRPGTETFSLFYAAGTKNGKSEWAVNLWSPKGVGGTWGWHFNSLTSTCPISNSLLCIKKSHLYDSSIYNIFKQDKGVVQWQGVDFIEGKMNLKYTASRQYEHPFDLSRSWKLGESLEWRAGFVEGRAKSWGISPEMHISLTESVITENLIGTAKTQTPITAIFEKAQNFTGWSVFLPILLVLAFLLILIGFCYWKLRK